MVDIFILLSYLPSNVSDNLWRSLWYISCKIVVTFKIYVFFVANKIPSFSLFAGKLCSKMALYFIWPFGKSLNKVVRLCFFFSMYLFENFIHSIKLLYSLKIPKSNLCLVKAANVAKCSVMRRPACEVIPDGTNSVDSDDDLIEVPSLVNVGIPVPEPQYKQHSNHWVRKVEVSLSTFTASTCDA